MARKTYISFKAEDMDYKGEIQVMPGLDVIDKSLNEPIDSTNDDYIMQKIRSDYLADSTVTIFLIGQHSAERLGTYEQRFIKRELQASLYNGAGNTKNGILGVVLPTVNEQVFGGNYNCGSCGGSHNLVRVNDDTVISEFSYNYYIPNGKCSHTEDERYCVLTSWADFSASPNTYVEQAFAKRTAPIAAKTKVRP